MNKKFISKVLCMGKVDTKNYRYGVVPHPDQINHPGARQVVRIPLGVNSYFQAVNEAKIIASVFPNPCGVMIKMI